MLARVTDPRQPRGVRHRLDGVLAVALAATLAGVDSVGRRRGSRPQRHSRTSPIGSAMAGF
ncbi:transposase family protein [Mycobacterium helveticum]|uniref:Transposase family protein n=1 Tax=Mycobacterium helveticum TaxID=2592811 RepID=A0A557XN40_9MYCO|nr:transposase family protein [Mycobacterium helveticum]TVS87263.1 transposase family protein [Mycobacterium helveticum]